MRVADRRGMDARRHESRDTHAPARRPRVAVMDFDYATVQTTSSAIFGTNVVRGDSQFRVDLRLDKRAVWNSWLLDFYVDIINTTVATESGGLIGASSIRYVVPTIGFRAVL